jgi:hypothetical protein
MPIERRPSLAERLNRQAFAINERSPHAPRSLSKRQHGAGCDSCSGTASMRYTRNDKNGNTSFPSKQLWMTLH